MPTDTAAQLYAARIAQARQQLIALSAALDTHESIIADRHGAYGVGASFTDVATVNMVIEQLTAAVHFLRDWPPAAT